MTRVAFDQLLQVTASAPTSRPSSRSSSDEGDLFRSHLDRAAEAADPKDESAVEKPEVAKTEEEQPLEVASEDQENATADNAAAEDVPDAEAAQSRSSEEEPVEESSSEDEVTLSAAAAVIEVETQVVEEVPVEEISSVPTEDADGNQQQNHQAAQQAADGPTLVTEVATTEGTFAVEETPINVLPEEPSPAAGEVDNEQRSQQASANQVAAQTVGVTAAAAAATDVAKESTAETKQSNKPQPATPTTTANQTLEAVPEQDKSRDSTPRTQVQENSSRAVATATELLDSPESDLATPPNAQVSETTSKPATPVTNNQVVADIEKTVGNVNTNTSSNSTANTSNSSTPDTPVVDRVRFVQRVSGAIRSAQQRDGQIQLRLSPPELGTLKIQLTVNESAITANLETETTTARTILLDNLPALRERLAEQGMTIEKFDVDVGREGQQHQAEDRSTSDRESQQSDSEREEKAAGSRRDLQAAQNSISQASAAAPDSGLDVRI